MYPETWSVKSLSEIIDYKAGRTPSRANNDFWQKTTFNIPWVAISDMEPYSVITHTSESISPHAFDTVFRGKIVPAGTLLMSFKLTIGRISTLGIPACHNEAIISIYPKADIDQRYLGYFLSQIDFENLQDRQVKGNTLNQEKIDRIPVAVPPLEEQKEISSVLDLIRSVIEEQERALSVTQELKRATMRELFTRGLRGEKQKETEIGLVPKSWDVVPFEKVREWLQYGTSIRCGTSPTKCPVLRIPNIEQGRVDSSDLKYCELSEKEAANYELQHGDLIFIRTNGVLERLGCCAVYEGTPSNALFASYLIRARPLNNLVVPRFATYFFGSQLGTSLIAGRATPAADGKYNLNTGIIDSIPLPLPPTLDEQREIVEILDAIDKKIDLHKRKKTVLEELFKSLLHKLMTGEIRVTDLDLSALDMQEKERATA